MYLFNVAFPRSAADSDLHLSMLAFLPNINFFSSFSGKLRSFANEVRTWRQHNVHVFGLWEENKENTFYYYYYFNHILTGIFIKLLMHPNAFPGFWFKTTAPWAQRHVFMTTQFGFETLAPGTREWSKMTGNPLKTD